MTSASEKKLKIVGLVLVLVALIALLYSQIDNACRFIVSFIPYSYEVKANKFIELEEYFRPCEMDEKQRTALQEIVDRLYPLSAKEKEQPIRVQVVDEKIPNAFTFFGGQIILFKGLLDFVDDADELAGVLAHEIEHARNRHVATAILRSTLLVSMLNFVSGDFGGLIVLDPTTVQQLLNLSFSRKMENEADQYAIERLLAVKINPEGFKRFFQKLQNKDNFLDSFLSTHPTSKERAEWVEKYISKSQTFIPVLNYQQFMHLKASCSTLPKTSQ